MIVLERNDRVVVASQAWLVTQDREMAWAEDLVRHNKMYAWILGKYVGSGSANLNGHIFAADELRASTATLLNAPMNMLHHPRHIVGSYVGHELVYPTGTGAGPVSASAAMGLPDEAAPFTETLAAMWRYYFPDEYTDIKDAHEAGMLSQSMECVPESVTCARDDCGKTFAYAGRTAETYCDHLNGPPSPKKLNNPHFTGGGLVLPPARPAWRAAKISDLSTAASAGLRLAEREGIAAELHDQVAAELPGLDSADWEAIMGLLVMACQGDTALEDPTSPKPPPGPPDQPHAYEPSHVEGTPLPLTTPPCVICGLPHDSPIHLGMGTVDTREGADDGSGDLEASVMVALVPPPEVAARFEAITGRFSDPVTDSHITLAFLGSDAVSRLDRATVEAALAPLAAVTAPIEGSISGVGRFAVGYPAGSEAWPLYASLDAPVLPAFRQMVVGVLAGAGVPVADDHGFSPHMTLAYVANDADQAAAAAVLAEGIEAVSVTFGSLVLAWGADMTEFAFAEPVDGDGDLSAARDAWEAAMAAVGGAAADG